MNLVLRPARAGAAVALVLALAMTLATTSCSGGDESDDEPAPQSTADGSSFAIKTTANIGQVSGKLSKKDRQHLVQSVTRVSQRWFNAAYVAGDYPRSNFKDAFPGFTRKAALEAKHDRALLTNQDIGTKIDDVTPTRSKLAIDVLAPGGRPVGATARFQLWFRTDGDQARRVRVQGRLMLTRIGGHGWQIFGYHVSKSSSSKADRS